MHPLCEINRAALRGGFLLLSAEFLFHSAPVETLHDHPAASRYAGLARKTDDLTEPKIPPEPFEQGGTGGISVFMPARRGCARARPFPDGIPAPVRCVSRQTKGNKAEERLDFCIYRTAKQRFCQGFENKRGKMLFQDVGQAYHPAGGNAALCAV